MNYLRYLSPKSPFSERGLAIASLKSLFMYMSVAFAKAEESICPNCDGK